MMVTRSCRPVHGGGGNAHERATPLRYACSPPIRDFPWRTQWDPYHAVSRFPPFACAPSVPHVECAGVSPLHFNPKGNELNPVHLPAAAPLSISPARPSTSAAVQMRSQKGVRLIPVPRDARASDANAR